jgi:hypothetical protein
MTSFFEGNLQHLITISMFQNPDLMQFFALLKNRLSLFREQMNASGEVENLQAKAVINFMYMFLKKRLTLQSIFNIK